MLEFPFIKITLNEPTCIQDEIFSMGELCDRSHLVEQVTTVKSLLPQRRSHTAILHHPLQDRTTSPQT